MTGLAIGGVGVGSGGDLSGVGIAGVGVGAGGTILGLAIGGIGVGAPTIRGVAISAIGVGGQHVRGVAIAGAWMQIARDGEIRGMSVSAFNQVKGSQRGLAIGIVNYANELHGVQAEGNTDERDQIIAVQHVCRGPTLVRNDPGGFRTHDLRIKSHSQLISPVE